MISFLVQYSKSQGLRRLAVIPSLKEAMELQFHFEKLYQDDEDKVVVALQANSLESLFKHHNRFFWVKV